MNWYDTRLSKHGLSAAIYSVAFLALGVIALGVIGCNQTDYTLVPLAGQISLDGQPLANARVLFTPIGSGVGPASHAETNEDGHFELRTLDLDSFGAVPGKHRVKISSGRSSGTDERAILLPENTIAPEKVPAHYRNGSYQLDVPADGSTNIEIKILTKRR